MTRLAGAVCWAAAVLALAAARADAEAARPAPKQPWNATWTDKLKRDLLRNYDKFARPAAHNTTTTVSLRITFRHIEMDELKSIMTVHGWVKMGWTDEKLKWNESEYGGLSMLHIADHEIWQPDIVLYNSAMGSTVDHYGNTHCIAYSSGSVLWVPPAQFLVFCDLNLRLWPFDTQACYLRLGSWTYDGNAIDLQIDDLGSEIELMEENSEWELVDVEESVNLKMYDCCTEPYPDIIYNVTLRRRSPSYNALIITPASVIVLMTLANFWLPPQAGEKILLGGCTAIIICIFLLYFSQKLPAMASHTPLVVLFYSSSLYLVCLSLVVSVVVINLSRSRHAAPLPWVVKNVLTGWLGRALGLGHIIAQVHHVMMSGHAEEMREPQPAGFEEHGDDRQMIPREKAGCQHDWVLLAAAVDRLAFLVYCLVFVVLAIVYAV
ncbi:acetylcholine receptor subunit alpha-type acr-16-like [Bacillus rossius redtenbacheri]|uniref:acetylcholine receptor subunit alpha-type acr-16-like n=1 Tax=Bacillus rossius redtenbacheri TaxID=93214 RepID=UPI002FDCA2B3